MIPNTPSPHQLSMCHLLCLLSYPILRSHLFSLSAAIYLCVFLLIHLKANYRQPTLGLYKLLVAEFGSEIIYYFDPNICTPIVQRFY